MPWNKEWTLLLGGTLHEHWLNFKRTVQRTWGQLEKTTKYTLIYREWLPKSFRKLFGLT